jgi:hypothetical protein
MGPPGRGNLLRLIALESHRHRAVVIGEDLATVPDGLREQAVGVRRAGTRPVARVPESAITRMAGGLRMPSIRTSRHPPSPGRAVDSRVL